MNIVGFFTGLNVVSQRHNIADLTKLLKSRIFPLSPRRDISPPTLPFRDKSHVHLAVGSLENTNILINK